MSHNLRVFGVSTSVTFDNGQVTIDLDLSGATSADSSDGFTTCTDGGLSWHIHEFWDHTDVTEGLIGSTNCGL